jgi:phosphoglycolate phosphatase-like HAD superfamily hydrolase
MGPKEVAARTSGSSRRRAILDVDGTLVDSNYQHVIAWRRAFAASGLNVPAWRIHRHIGMGSDRLVGELVGEELERSLGDEIRSAHSDDYEKRIDEVPALEGARGLIEALAERDFDVVLASSAEASEIDHYVDLLDARELLCSWTTAADVETTKPAGDLVEAALSDAEADRALMIGDTPWDAIAARRSGVAFVGVLCGGFPEADLHEEGAVAVYESLPALTAALDELEGLTDSRG